MDDYGTPKLTDFGLSRFVICSQPLFEITNDNKSGGTLNWTAYELFSSIDIDGALDDEISLSDKAISNEKSDAWSFGMVLYVSLTGN